MTFQTADQAKARNIDKMGKQLGEIYSELWQEVVFLNRKWHEFVELFGTSKENVDLLNRAAPSFAHLLQQAFWKDVLLGLCRITDPVRSAGKHNLTIKALADHVDHAPTQALVRRLIDEADSATGFCRDWRNRHIAHSDLALALEHPGARPLEPASRDKVVSALRALGEVMNAVALHYLEATVAFDFVDHHGGAAELLRVLNDGVRVRDERRTALNNAR